MSDSVTFALIADAHVQGGNRRHLPEIVDRIRALDPPPAFIVSLGDNVYGRPENDVVADVRAYHAEVTRLRSPHYYVLGSHDTDAVTRFGQLQWDELLTHWQMSGRWYGFAAGTMRGLVLDTGRDLLEPQGRELLEAQVEWLRGELQALESPALIFAHEALGFGQHDLEVWRLEDNRNFWPMDNPLQSAIEEHSSIVAGVFAGHKHRSLHKRCEGVDYHLVAAAYQHGGQFALVTVCEDGTCAVCAQPEAAPNTARTVQESYQVRWLG